MNLVLLAVAAGAALLLLGARKGAPTDPIVVSLTGFSGPTSQALPIRVPAPVMSQPEDDAGADREDETGRTWGTFYVNRDKKKHHELLVLRVAESAGNAAIGNGEVIADLYETVVAGAGWAWNGQACSAVRFRLTMRQGHLQKTELVQVMSNDKPLPTCQSVRPVREVLARKIAWVQRGADIFLVVDTESGLNKRSPDMILRPGVSKPGKYSGTGVFSADASKDFEVEHPQWDNDFVASGDMVVDVSWIFNPTDAQGNPV